MRKSILQSSNHHVVAKKEKENKRKEIVTRYAGILPTISSSYLKENFVRSSFVINLARIAYKKKEKEKIAAKSKGNCFMKRLKIVEW